MPDQRAHRGPHPEDRELFAPSQLGKLSAAAAELGWLLSRGYAPRSSIQLVGDRHALVDRQRIAVRRCVCAESDRVARAGRAVSPHHIIAGEVVLIDGFNVLTTIEAALAGGIVLTASEGCFRDMASMHGTYRRVVETSAAIEMIGRTLAGLGLTETTWYFDQPVSNSGDLAHAVKEIGISHQWTWNSELVPDPDKVLAQSRGLVCTADSGVLDCEIRWLNLARLTVEQHVPTAWVVDFVSSEARAL